MLRISKKERKQLYNLNARVNKLLKTNQKLYNIQPQFRTSKPSEFLTRREVNHYKTTMKAYLKENKYLQGGHKDGSRYFFPISREMVKERQEAMKSGNRYTYALNREAKRLHIQTGGKKEHETLYQKSMSKHNQVKKKGLRAKASPYFTFRQYEDITKINSPEKWAEHIYGIKNFNNYGARVQRYRQARENYINALYNTFGDIVDPIVQILEQLNPLQFNLLYDSEEFVDFDYIYDNEYKMTLLKDITNGIYTFMEQTKLFYEPKYFNLTKQLAQILHIDSVTILSNYTDHHREWTESDGTKYAVNLRTDEIENFDENGPTDSIRKRARVLKIGRNGIRKR